MQSRDHKKVFSNIYDKDIWGNGSGSGSSYKYCKRYVEFLQKFMKEKQIKNVLDLGCGDWQFSEYVDWSGINYEGIDVVQSVIEANKEKHSAPHINFVQKNLSQVGLIIPYLKTDNQLILMKDVLMHWTNEEVEEWMDKFIPRLPLKTCFLITNNWKYYRKPERNEEPRELDKKFSWSPIDSQKAPLNKYGFEIVFNYRVKQVSLYKSI